MGRVVFEVIGVVVPRSVVLLVLAVAVRGQPPQSWSAAHLTPGVSQQAEYSVRVTISLYAKGIYLLQGGALYHQHSVYGLNALG